MCVQKRKTFPQLKVYHWTNEEAKLNYSFPRIARQSLSSSLASSPIAQETQRRCKRSARDQSFMCNRAASFSRCLTKVHDSMATQLKIIQSDKPKGTSARKTQKATEELAYLLTFNQSITQAMARTMQGLSDCIFINLPLTSPLCNVIDTLAGLNSCLNMSSVSSCHCQGRRGNSSP